MGIKYDKLPLSGMSVMYDTNMGDWSQCPWCGYNTHEKIFNYCPICGKKLKA